MHIRFGEGEIGFRCLGEGWSDVEDSQVWAVGRRSTLIMPTLVWCATGYTVTIEAEPFPVPGHTQFVYISINGTLLGQSEVIKNVPIVLSLSENLLRQRGRKELVFETSYGISPASLGHGDDQRQLSFSLARVFIKANLHAPDLIEPSIMGLTDQEMMMRFESLGDDCEFGFVQRAHKAEPISLLRFGGMALHRLHEALERQFAGIDKRENLSIRVHEPGEYMMLHNKYRYAYHTFIQSWQMSREDLITREIMRLQFGRRKLIEDLEDGDKIFVVKTSLNPGLRRDDVVAVAELIACYGKATLLWVRPADDDVATDTIRWISPNLIEARIDQLCLPGQAVWFSPRWLTICRKVYRAVQQHRQPASLPKAAE